MANIIIKMAKLESNAYAQKETGQEFFKKGKITENQLRITIRKELCSKEDEVDPNCFCCKAVITPPEKIFKSYEGFPLCSLCARITEE